MIRLRSAWNDFWFAPEPTSVLALVRIAFGLVALAWSLSLLPDLGAFFGPDGVVPTYDDPSKGVWTLLGASPGDGAVTAMAVALVVGCVALTAGAATRVAAVVVFVGLVSFQRRDPYVFNSGDGLLPIIALVLALSPAGAALSVDRLVRSRDRFWEIPARAPWALRLLQVQLSLIYLSTAWSKASGSTWDDGTAVSYTWRLEDLERFPMPDALATSLLVSNLATYGTVMLEVAIGVLVWVRVARPWVLGLGVLMHLGIDLFVRVGFFSYAMFVCYLAFLSPGAANRVVAEIRARFERRGAARTDESNPRVEPQISAGSASTSSRG